MQPRIAKEAALGQNCAYAYEKHACWEGARCNNPQYNEHIVFLLGNASFTSGACLGACGYFKRKSFFLFKTNKHPNKHPT